MRDHSLESVARVLRECLAEGRSVEIERIGTFRPSSSGGFEFQADERPTVFLAYVEEDRAEVLRLYQSLEACGFRPWMDQKKLLPGQNWPRAIEGAIQTSDFFVSCLSRRAVIKRGTFQSEMRWALDCARHMPLDSVYFVPVRLEECSVPARIRTHLQYVDLFPDRVKGTRKLIATMRDEMLRRTKYDWPLAS
jgi:hypothetical protein